MEIHFHWISIFGNIHIQSISSTGNCKNPLENPYGSIRPEVMQVNLEVTSSIFQKKSMQKYPFTGLYKLQCKNEKWKTDTYPEIAG